MKRDVCRLFLEEGQIGINERGCVPNVSWEGTEKGYVLIVSWGRKCIMSVQRAGLFNKL